ncbi:MAG: tyrosine-type recombinase/integrase [Gammaproteobacteria bacterium]|nr:tyrosine-type recombinase/integrase [Gammaproteobacteria bacterium]
MLPQEEARICWLSGEAAYRWPGERPGPVAGMMRCTLAAALPQAHVTGLEGRQLDLPRRCAWVHAEQAKAGKPVAVPLDRQACRVLRRQIGKHADRVFTCRGEPITKAG